MNTNEIKQRLIEAALTEDIPATPHFQMPGRGRVGRVGRVARQQESIVALHQKNWIGYAAAACLAAAIILAIPTLSHRSESTDSANILLTSNDPATELEYAFTMVNQHFAITNNLLQ